MFLLANWWNLAVIVSGCLVTFGNKGFFCLVTFAVKVSFYLVTFGSKGFLLTGDIWQERFLAKWWHLAMQVSGCLVTGGCKGLLAVHYVWLLVSDFIFIVLLQTTPRRYSDSVLHVSCRTVHRFLKCCCRLYIKVYLSNCSHISEMLLHIVY